MLPDNWFGQLSGFDAIFFGAVGGPEVVPDHISLWGSLLQFRRHFDQYVNLRPVKLMPGVVSPLAGRGPGDVDFYVVRENTEGEYLSIGVKIFEGTDRETVVQETVMTRVGVDRILEFAFKLAQIRPRII
jgi:tartrate dehydrogenase/decarboxylase/D-malate dehydrogenase